MRFTALLGDLLTAIQTVQYSSNPKGMMPILTGVKLEAEEAGVSLHATDLESYSTTACSASVEETGACVVNTRIFMDYLRNSEDEKLKVELVGNELVLEGSRNIFRIYTMPVEDFPNMPVVENPLIEDMETAGFLSSVQKVAKSSSRDEKRPTLTGILFEVEEDKLTMISTDSYRLSINTIVGGYKAKEPGQYIIPATAMVNLAKIAGKKEKINIYGDENKAQVRFDLGTANYIVRLIEGKFPRYNQFIPESMEKAAEVEKAKLLGAIKRISLVNSTVKINLKSDEITLSSESREVGEGEERIEAEYSGEEMVIAFNAQFLEDGLTSLEGEKAMLVVSEPLKPGIVKEREREDYIYIIMPIRL